MGLIQWLENLIEPEKKQQKELEWEQLNARLIELHNAGSYPEAIPIAEQTRKLAVRIWGATHPNVATSCNNLAQLYQKQNRLEEAEALLLKAIEIDRKALSADHPGLATDLNNLAELYYRQNRLEEAEPLFLEAIALGKKALPADRPSLGAIFHNLAGLLAASDRPEAAFKLMLRGNKIDDTNIRRYLSASSQSDVASATLRERLAYFQSIRGNLDFFLSLVCQYLTHSAAAKQAALNLVLKRKTLTANSAILTISGDRYPQLEKKLARWRQLGDKLLELSYDIPSPEEVAEELARVQKERNDLQRQLGRKIPVIRLQELSWDRKAVASCLPAGASLVEFVRFDLYDFEEKRWQNARYLAFVLPAGQPSRVEMADLGDAVKIDKLISQFRETLAAGSQSAPHLYNKEAGCRLREAIFDKLRPALGSCRNLVLAPDGDLNLVPLAILPLEDGDRILRDECAINSASSGRELLRNSIDLGGKPGPALAVGAPNYDFGKGDDDDDEAPARFQILPETEDLAAAVGKRLGAETLLGDAALVGELLGRRSPRVLFLAVSGFFFEEDGEEDSSTLGHLGGNFQDWMLRCGIALAGANTGSLGGELPPEAGRGVIFARDIAAWDLTATELAILVPCQGGELGGEGVLGLRRAFAAAGAKTLITSLWKVSVYRSILLMERLFDCLEAGAIAAEALEVAQDYLKNLTIGELRESELGMKVLEELELGEEHPPGIKPLKHPYYWGAWVCQGMAISN